MAAAKTSKVTCGVCGTKRQEAECHIEKTTDEDRRVFAQSGQKIPDQLVYCKPCWKTLTDPTKAPSVMKGLFQMRLRQLGVGNAEELANRYVDGLIKKMKKTRPS